MAGINENEPLRVKTNGLIPAEIELEPSQIREQTLSPDLIHALAIIAGYDGSHEHIAKVDATGKLMVNVGTSSVTEYEASKATYDSTTPSAPNLTFSAPVSNVDLHIEDNDINLELESSLTGTLGDIITLPVGDVSIPYTTSALALWCNVSGSTSTVQVVGWR